ncbi:MAG: PHP domain-containing protein [Chitinophagales bacterium]
MGDYHTHSTYSDGQEGLYGVLEAARHRGLTEVAITDHGPNLLVLGVDDLNSYQQLQEEIDNLENPPVRVLAGAEANIIDLEGNLDVPAKIYNKLDVLICGLHPYSIPGNLKDGYQLFARNHLRHLGKGMKEQAINANTKATIAAINDHPVDILSHPGLFFEVDVEEVAEACVRENVKFEINCAHHFPAIDDIETAYQVGVDFIVDSDGHFFDTIGVLDYGAEVIEKLQIPPERVHNSDLGGEKQWRSKRTDLMS